MPVPARKAKDYKSDIKPVWCPGCGHFAVLAALTKAMAHLGLVKENVAVVSGIGCSSRLPAYIDSYGFHGIHGRALAAASGLKAARPDLTVIVAGGDGDGFSIGGNHFLHACRRNMDMTYIVMDNEVYGMTKGQASPTTRPTWRNSKMTPHGTGIPSFNPAAIALAAGAGFIARGYSGEPSELTRLLVEAMQHPGFSFVQVLSGCVTFRPDQRGWKELVHPFINDLPTEDRIKAAQIIQADDGKATGVIYATEFPVWQPESRTETELSELEEEFYL
ncbi:MAG: 2-oxoacid:ferredoxin oxidoreductase subunit beta [Candidatus Thiodiazotropha sp. (ex Dulcina madagascariensis)]|nr:2-oxoacid:ferredoxin oxidoreductase subunit beta [Candidatus Thiodiazotropha sp. (ex Dulcina madagascariensis)]MCU7926615.1 2-oxoacid:ferredoxin oxidoreductase subunit beta [Candidatus Thiodiazotropha sp. (ex Dulcina madagascariensis)]